MVEILSEDYSQQFFDMVKGIARRASRKLYDRDVEDIEQDLWVKILDVEERRGSELDQALAAKICWDYVTDMQRSDIRKKYREVNVDPDEFDAPTRMRQNDDKQRDFQSSELVARQDSGDYASDVAIRDLYDQFPIGTKERMFLDFYGNASGVMPNDRMVVNPTKRSDGYTETNLAKMLGFPSQASSTYRKFKQKMYKIIQDYLG